MLFVDKRYSVDVSSNIVIEYTNLRPWRSSRSNIFRSFKILRQDWNINYFVSTLSNRNSSLENSATRKKGKGNWKNGLYWHNACSSCWRRGHGAILAQMTLKKTPIFYSSSKVLLTRIYGETFASRMTLQHFLLQILFLVCLCDATLGCTPGESPVKLENRSDSFVKGCYCKNERLSLCFEIQRGFVQLTDTNNNVLVQFSKPNRQRTHVKVLGHDFLW